MDAADSCELNLSDIPDYATHGDSSHGSPPSYLGKKFSKLDPRNHPNAKFIASMIAKHTSGFRSSASLFLKGVGGYSQGASKALTSMKFVSALTLPFSIMDFFSASKGVIKEEKKIDKAESGFNAVSEAGSVMEGFVGLTIAGMAFRAFCTGAKFTTPAWADIFGLGGLGFSVFNLVYQTSGLVRTYYCVHKMNEALGDKELEPEERVEKVIEFLEGKCLTKGKVNPKYLNRKFSIEYGSAVMKRLQDVRNASNKEQAVKEAQKELNYLKRRAWKLIGFKGLKISAIVITIIGVAVLMFTPYSYIGYALLIASVGMGIVAGTLQFNFKREGKNDPKAPKKQQERLSFRSRVYRPFKRRKRKRVVTSPGSEVVDPCIESFEAA